MAVLDRKSNVLASTALLFLKLLRQFTEQGRYVSPSPSNTYAPKVLGDHPDAEGMSKRALKAAMETLFTRGEIEVRHHGTGAKARSHVALKDGGQP